MPWLGKHWDTNVIISEIISSSKIVECSRYKSSDKVLIVVSCHYVSNLCYILVIRFSVSSPSLNNYWNHIIQANTQMNMKASCLWKAYCRRTCLGYHIPHPPDFSKATVNGKIDATLSISKFAWHKTNLVLCLVSLKPHPFSHFRHQGQGLDPIPAIFGQKWGTPWTSPRFITGPTQRNHHPYTQLHLKTMLSC